jgi:ATP-binding cassette subfamily F protein uup
VKQSSTSQTKPVAKLSFKEEKELAEIPLQIEQLETEQADINNQLADGDLYRTQAELVKTLQSRLLEIDTLLENLLARWESLDARKS